MAQALPTRKTVSMPQARAAAKGLEVGLRQRQRQGRPRRACAHRGQITEVDRQRLVAERSGIGIDGKMSPLDQGVDAHRERLPSRRLQQRAVVTDTDQDIIAGSGRMGEVLPDQVEFGDRHRGSAISAGLPSPVDGWCVLPCPARH